ncbi:MAG: sigma-70 family RNA polymerase sigma factor [Planctomycetes bacterium]|nr:sigma-70 family RNA polymerase sigma factor [Planctomycetota bacterium]
MSNREPIEPETAPGATEAPWADGAFGPEGYPELRARLVRYARKLAGDAVLDGRTAEDWADLALLKLWRGERKAGAHEAEVVLFGTVRSLVHHARKRAERSRTIGVGEDRDRAEHSDVNALHLRDALRKVAERLSLAGFEDAREVVLCLLEHGGALLKPRELADALGWERARVYKAWERVKERFATVWNAGD